ncbi:MAG: filamentous hemagglutinin N-terminal domain-containing protein [Leptolyngbya sp. SIO3F4]|nr:filamentous hemagglutinin N-terminal domain-containing protein [Leptolyngbya sp. SIO3F4]
MYQQSLTYFTAISSLVSLLFWPSITEAQVNEETGVNSLGTQVNLGFFNSILEHQVTGGILSDDGNNLFHGFEIFSPNDFPVRFFDQGASNIFVRVTEEPSLIETPLSVEGNANFFLLNPNGASFGTGASLDLEGDFFATTATSVTFGAGNFEMDTDINDVMLLVDVPTGLQLGTTPIEITQGAQLITQPDSTLSILGAGINITDGGELISNRGQINLISAIDSQLAINPDLSLDCNSTGCANIAANNYRDIALTNASGARVLAGDLDVRGRNITLTDGSRLVTRPDGTQPGGTLSVSAQETLQLSGVNLFNESGLFAENLGAMDGFPGNIQIQANELILREGARLTTSTNGAGNGGNIDIVVPNIVSISGMSNADDDPSGIFSEALLSAVGTGGKITITTNQLDVNNGGTISTSTNGAGNGGSINIVVPEQVSISGTSAATDMPSGVFSESLTNATGQGGEIIISTNQLSISQGGTISSRTTSSETGGAVNLTTGRLTLENQGSITVSAAGASIAGNIEITATSIEQTNQGNIQATTESGLGGDITFTVSDDIILRFNSDIITEAQGSGDGGNIMFDVGGFILAILSENSDIVAGSQSGNGGRISGNAQGIFTFNQFEGVRTPLSDFRAASGSGLDGIVDVQTQEPPSQEPLDDTFAGNNVAQGCDATAGIDQDEDTQSRFVIVNLGGLPIQPSDAGASDFLHVTPVDPISPSQSNITSPDSATVNALAVLELPCDALVN